MRQITLDMGLGRSASLDNFVAGPNVAVLSHLQLWVGHARSGASLRSPVPTYLWGATGSGKTHLLQAVYAALQAQGGTVGWLDASMAEAPPFDERWTAIVLDDVHLYNAVQQHAAFTWFVQAQTSQQGVLAAGARVPAQLTLREDLRTRLGWGHVYELQPLGEAEQRTVLREAARARGILLSDEIMDFMLTRFSRDLGSLMQLLDQLDGYALQTQRAITIPLLKSMLETL